MKTELKYKYSNLDKQHCYYLLGANDAFSSWIWFHVGKNLTEKGNDFILYPFHSTWKKTKTILATKNKSARLQGERIAKKINTHYLIVKSKQK